MLEGEGYVQPAPLPVPNQKMGAPFQGWGLDTIVYLTPPAANGGMQVVVAICIFSRWVEAGIFPSLTS